MKILVLNCGSSSVKYKLIELDDNAQNVLAEGGVEKVGLPDSFLKFKQRWSRFLFKKETESFSIQMELLKQEIQAKKCSVKNY